MTKSSLVLYTNSFTHTILGSFVPDYLLNHPFHHSITHPITQSKRPRGSNRHCCSQVQSILINCSSVCVSLVPLLPPCSHSALICLQRLSRERPSSINKVDIACTFTLCCFHTHTHTLFLTYEHNSSAKISKARVNELSFNPLELHLHRCLHAHTQTHTGTQTHIRTLTHRNCCKHTALWDKSNVCHMIRIFQLLLKTVYLLP